MPKKFTGENSKAAVARARKAAVQHEAQAKKEQALEDEYWKDDDKQLQRKQQRKDEREKKHLEALERKKEAQQLLEAEAAALKSAKATSAQKITRAEIEAAREKAEREAAAAKKAQNLSVDEQPLEENANLILGDEGEARTVEDAISMLSVKDPAIDRHPEKRLKAAYQEFEDRRLPELKEENKNLRLSQLKQLLKKEWQKHPDNPLNQRHLVYNQK